MGMPLLDVTSTLTCPHGGKVTIAPGNPRVLLGKMPAATMADQFLIVGCLFTVPGVGPSPCVRIQWITPAARNVIGSTPAITAGSVGLCLAATGVPQGPPMVVASQFRVGGL